VQYTFDNKEHVVELRPHGNSKGKTPYRRTKPSTLHLIQKDVSKKPTSKILSDIENQVGGVINARAGCDMPRNRQQVYNASKSAKRAQNPSCHAVNGDTLAEVLQMCKETAATPDVFIRTVEAGPEPMCVLATQYQLTDMERFTTGEHFSILTVDPTFNLGPFNVTPCTYQHMLMTARPKFENHPLLLGPVLIHQTKTFHAFYYFASTLIRLNPLLKNIKAFGTDGEPELIKAFHCAFPNAVHLRCTNHLRQNIKDKLRSLGLSQELSKDIVADIFGRRIGVHFEKGLVDAEDKKLFQAYLKLIKQKWNNIERSSNPENEPQFHSWFCHEKAPIIIDAVLPEVRLKAHMTGDPVPLFTTNNSESINHIIKNEVEWKENKLPVLISHLKAVCDKQVSEMQKAVIGRGEWKLISLYNLEIPEDVWFQKSQEQRTRLLKKVMEARPFISTSTAAPLPTVQDLSPAAAEGILSVASENSGITTLSKGTLEGIWKKAETLIQTNGNIISVPWSTDKKECLVRSTTGDQPHLVKMSQDKQQYCCDDKCPMFKGFLICAHTVAAAQFNGNLEVFIKWYVANKCRPNLTSIAQEGMPKGVGRKGGVPKRKRQPRALIESTSSRFSVQDNNEPNPKRFTVTSDAIIAPVCTSVVTVIPPTQLPTAVSASVARAMGIGQQTIASSSITVPHVHPSQIQNTTNFLQKIISNIQNFSSVSSPPITTFTCCTTVTCQVSTMTTSTSTISSCSTSMIQHQATPALSTSINTVSGQVANILHQLLINTSGNSQALPTASPSNTYLQPAVNPFILKFKTNLIRVCQSCRQNFSPSVQLVVARAERRLVQNTTTGINFLGRESNSHYHVQLACLKLACPSFSGLQLIVPPDVKAKLTSEQIKSIEEELLVKL